MRSTRSLLRDSHTILQRRYLTCIRCSSLLSSLLHPLSKWRPYSLFLRWLGTCIKPTRARCHEHSRTRPLIIRLFPFHRQLANVVLLILPAVFKLGLLGLLPHLYRQMFSHMLLPTIHTASGLYLRIFASRTGTLANCSSFESSASDLEGLLTRFVLPMP